MEALSQHGGLLLLERGIERLKIRLDQHLSVQLKKSRSEISRWIRQGHVLLNGKKTKPSAQVGSQDRIDVTQPAITPTHLVPEAIPLDILFEDDDLLVINKSAQMVVHPGAGHHEKTLVHALLAHCKGLSAIGGVERPGIVHRLDKGTSGVMVVAKNDATHQALAHQFKNHEVEKIYWALVYGGLKQKKGTLESMIGRSPVHRKKFAVLKDRGKNAVTHYQVLKEGRGLNLVEVRIDTGRTHQIRVHLTHLGHGIVGDPLYGRRQMFEVDHPLLHAKSLSFRHPRTGDSMKFDAPLPDDFKKVVDESFS